MEDLVTHLCYKFYTDKLEKNEFDYFYGAIGVGNYLLEQKNIAFYDPVMASILDKNEKSNDLFCENNLGLAHGVPSKIAFICKLLDRFPDNPELLQILTRLVEYLLKFKLLDHEGIFFLPVHHLVLEQNWHGATETSVLGYQFIERPYI